VILFNDQPTQWPQEQRTESWLVDEHGQASLSWMAADGVFNLGFANTEVSTLVRSTVERHDIGMWSSPSRRRDLGEHEFSEALPPGLDRTAFTANQVEALELALKLARHRTGRTGVVSAADAVDTGRSLALASASPVYRPDRRRRDGIVLEHVPYGSTEALEHAVDDSTAAVYVEPIRVDAGVHEAPVGYLAAIRRICDERGALMVVDETTCGLLRTGSMWAFERHAVTPDLLISGNGLSGGYYPIGACSGAASVFADDAVLATIHHSTSLGNEIAAAVAGPVIRRYLDPGFQLAVSDAGTRLGDGLRSIQLEHDELIVAVRGRGHLYGVEVADALLRDPLLRACSRRGLICQTSRHESTVVVMPPLVISPGEIDEGLGIFAAAVARL
jgi:acetylornithine/succinyldiaminopimelate/putrescine aminotransferase